VYYKQITNQTDLKYVRLIHKTENQSPLECRNLQQKTLQTKASRQEITRLKLSRSLLVFLSDWRGEIADKNYMHDHGEVVCIWSPQSIAMDSSQPNVESNISPVVHLVALHN